jgi:hypothetical protein
VAPSVARQPHECRVCVLGTPEHKLCPLFLIDWDGIPVPVVHEGVDAVGRDHRLEDDTGLRPLWVTVKLSQNVCEPAATERLYATILDNSTIHIKA